MARRVLAVAAHPDDIEFMMAGTLILLGTQGYEAHLLTVADGCCGSVEMDADTTAAVRRREAGDAAAVIGATHHPGWCHDLEVVYSRENLARLAAVVREIQPEIVLTQSLSEYMEDHMNTTRLALTAAFARGMPNFTTEPDKPAYPDPVAVYHALPYGLRDPLGEPVHAAFYTDVGNVLATKREMLACHRSQKEWLDVSQGLDAYLETMESMARDMGRRSGRFEYAEGWTQHLPLGYGPEDWDPLTAVLAAHCTAPARPRP